MTPSSVLICDDDEVFRGVLAGALRARGHIPTECSFQDLGTQRDRFSAVVVRDDAMSRGGITTQLEKLIWKGLRALVLTKPSGVEVVDAGLDVAHWPQVPIIKNWHPQSAANGEPWTEESLKNLLEILSSSSRIQEIGSPYVPLAPEDLRSLVPFALEAFVRLPDEKFVKVFDGSAPPNDAHGRNRLEAYRAKGLRALWVKRQDFLVAVGLGALVSPSGMAQGHQEERTARFLKDEYARVLLEELAVDSFHESVALPSRSLMDAAMETLLQRQMTLGYLDQLYRHSRELFQQTLVGTLFSVMLSRAMQWNHPGTLFHLALSGLLRDVGMTELDTAYVTSSLADTDAGTRVLYEAHPLRSFEIISETKLFPETVLQPILQHHEACDGNGFPYQRRKNSILSSARVLAVADSLAVRVLGLQGLPRRMPLSDAVTELTHKNGEYDGQILSAALALWADKK